MHVENPLRMLRSGHLPMVKTRSRTATIPTASHSKAVERRSTPECSEISKSGKFFHVLIKYRAINLDF